MRIDRYVHDERLTWGAAGVLLTVSAMHAAGIARLFVTPPTVTDAGANAPIFQVSLERLPPPRLPPELQPRTDETPPPTDAVKQRPRQTRPVPILVDTPTTNPVPPDTQVKKYEIGDELLPGEPGPPMPEGVPGGEGTEPGPAVETPVYWKLKLVDMRPPVYPPRCLRMGIEGRVRVRVLVGENGKVQEVTLDSSSGESALDESALEAVRTWRFEPARRNGVPVRAWAIVPVEFKLLDHRQEPVMHPTEALTTMSFANFLRETDAVGLFVFALLVLMSIVSWYFIFLKSARVIRIRTRSSHVVSTFWKTPVDQAIGYLERQPDWEPFSKIALDGEFAMAHHDQLTEDRVAGTLHRAEFLDRALRAAINREMERLETGLTFLATVGSTAPFVGLFGTVWGIFHALVRIGASGETSLDQVAGPVGEALIMTALGLAVAVPAVLGYNLLVRNNRVIIASFHAFAEDLLAYLTTGARVPSSMDHHRAHRLQQSAA